jgi:small membrane protein
MILIQFIFIIAIVFVLVRFLAYRNSLQTKAWKKILLLFFAIAAILFILYPNHLDSVAHLVGVGRGADLLLYALTIAFIFEQLNNYVKAKEENKRIVILARKIAIT